MFEDKLYRFIHEKMLPNGNFRIDRFNDHTADNVEGYLCSVSYYDIKTIITIFVIKSEYNAWLRDKKIDELLR